MKMEILEKPAASAMRWPSLGAVGSLGTDFGGLVNLLQVDAVIAGSLLNIRIGDSRTYAFIHGSVAHGKNGAEEMREMGKTLVNVIRSSLPEMTGRYKDFYGKVLKDFEENGFIIPGVGKLL